MWILARRLSYRTRGPSKTEVFRSTSSPLYAGRHVSPRFTRLCPRFPTCKPPTGNALLVPRKPPQHCYIVVENPARCRQTSQFGTPNGVLHCSMSPHRFFTPRLCKGGVPAIRLARYTPQPLSKIGERGERPGSRAAVSCDLEMSRVPTSTTTVLLYCVCIDDDTLPE